MSLLSNSLRVAVIGNVDSGKSSLVGVLTRNVLDDGRGIARSFVFHHKHEKETGRSSAVSCEIMGFEGEKPVHIDAKLPRAKMWSFCHAHSEKTITFVDLCGHERYLKTTIFGLMGLLPDYGMVIVGANMGVSRMTKEHIGIAAALGLPLVIVVTKLDISPAEVLKHTLESISKVLKQARKMPFQIRTPANAVTAAAAILTDRITPIVCVSNVTGEGLDLLRLLLSHLPSRVSSMAKAGEPFVSSAPIGNGLGGGGAAAGTTTAVSAVDETSADIASGARRKDPDAPAAPPPPPDAAADAAMVAAVVADLLSPMPIPAAASSVSSGVGGSSASGSAQDMLGQPGEATIDSIFNVPGVGTVVAGTVLRGCIHSGSTMLLGPDRTGEFHPVTVRSIHVQYTPVDVAYPGGSAAFAIRPKGKAAKAGDKRSRWARKGMALVDASLVPSSFWEFQAEILVLHHQTTLSVGYAPIMHCGVVSQSARITSIRSALTGEDIPALRTGDRAVICCRFHYHPEYMRVGETLLFREGRAKGVGRIRALMAAHGNGGSAGEPVGALPVRPPLAAPLMAVAAAAVAAVDGASLSHGVVIGSATSAHSSAIPIPA